MAKTAGACGGICSNTTAIAAITSLFVRDEIGIDGEQAAASGQRFDFRFGYHDYRGLETSLLGAVQFNNAAIAATLFLLWLQRAQPRKAPERIEAAVRDGLRDTQWPGRLEIISAKSADGDRCRPYPRRHPAIAGEPEGDPWRR